jgi:hypothetical protein
LVLFSFKFRLSKKKLYPFLKTLEEELEEERRKKANLEVSVTKQISKLHEEWGQEASMALAAQEQKYASLLKSFEQMKGQHDR